MSRTQAGTTTYMTWDTAGELPLLLAEGSSSYIYGPEGIPFEQINGEGQVLYLHHDDIGSTRVLTNSTGKVQATFTYGAYGTLTASTGTTPTTFGYAGQASAPETGLIYLRARYYDPTTAQFLTPDPMEETTGEPYTYGGGDPVSNSDPSGQMVANPHTRTLTPFQQREQYLWIYFDFTAKLHTNGTAGTVGNLVYESKHSLNPSEPQEQPCSPCGIGIAQWTVTGSRWAGLVSFAHKDLHESAFSLSAQARWIYQELVTELRPLLAELRTAKSIGAAIIAFREHFEKAASFRELAQDIGPEQAERAKEELLDDAYGAYRQVG
ncbi:MAG TPA: phage tail tip lysozyme [Solirubrobacteraceae bacterium]|nr:phage tail tip lysozyme [Solirubrobacteraceae bacterium]